MKEDILTYTTISLTPNDQHFGQFPSGAYSLTTGICKSTQLYHCHKCILDDYSCNNLAVTLPIILKHHPEFATLYLEVFI